MCSSPQYSYNGPFLFFQKVVLIKLKKKNTNEKYFTLCWIMCKFLPFIWVIHHDVSLIIVMAVGLVLYFGTKYITFLFIKLAQSNRFN